MSCMTACLLTLLCVAEVDAEQINPVARPVLTTTLHEWTFEEGDDGWQAEHNCRLKAEDGLLKIEATGEDPYLHCPIDVPGGRTAVTLRARAKTSGPGTIFWTTDLSPHREADKLAHFSVTHDGQWREYTARFDAPGRLTDIRLDPGQGAGTFDIDWIRVIHEEPHPLWIERVDRVGDRVRFRIKNYRNEPLAFSTADEHHTIEGRATLDLFRPIDVTRPLDAISIELLSAELPPVRRTIFAHNRAAKTDWIKRPLGPFALKVAKNGLTARVERDGKLIAILGPTVHCDGKLPALKRVDESSLRFEGEGVSVSLAIDGSELFVSIDSQEPCEGPVVRVFDELEQGLLAGLEYLGKGEKSSSKLDIETAEHLRFAPDRLKVTMPLMSFVTSEASVAMTWTDMQLQPIYATPNFFDAADDHRMALQGKKIEAVIRFDRAALEETILWAVKKQGLPPLPDPPRTQKQQWDICLKSLNGPLRNENGWGHCVQENWKRQPFASIASTIWRLTGEAPELPELVPGGTHVANSTIHFVTGRTQQWLDWKRRQIAALIAGQQPDGSYRYDGKYRRGHFENTASGICSHPAFMLMEHAYITGDRDALQSGLRTLQYVKRFRTPRGAQTWEVPLHTPDQLASAQLVWAYVRAYELTGKQEYLKLARKWALTGIPFVYLWDCQPIMLYSTPPVFGATFWRHSWFGLPVQWVGGVYAYALTKLAPYDDTLDWNHLARGILISGEQQQYPDGPYIGLLPDSFNIPHQRRQPADINPCALVSLRMVLDGQLDFLSIATEGEHRIAAPFPVSIRDGKAHIKGKPGVAYQVLIDGQKIVDVQSQGEDVLPLL